MNRKDYALPHELQAKSLQIIAEEAHGGTDQIYTNHCVDPENG